MPQKKKVTESKDSVKKKKNVSSEKKKTTKNKTEKEDIKKKKSTVVEEVIPYIDELSTIKEEPEKKTNQEIKKGDSHNNLSIYGIVVLLVLAIVLLGVYSYLRSVHDFTEKGFTSLGIYTTPVFQDEYKVFTEGDEFHHLFPQFDTSTLQFDKYNYIVLPITYDSCSESNFKPAGYYLNEGILTVRFHYHKSCGGCAPLSLYYLLEVDKNTYFYNVEREYVATNRVDC